MATQVQNNFCSFFEQWMSQLEEYVHLLVRSKNSQDNEGNFKTLVNKLTQHHKDYYTAKWAGLEDDVLLFFAPVWLSPLENAYSWITGWKPSTIFSLVDSLKKGQVVPGTTTTSLVNLTDQQLQELESLRVRIRVEENKVEREMERKQVYLADFKMYKLARLVSSIENRDGDTHVDTMVDDVLKELRTGLESVVRMADYVRLKTLRGILELLSPVQSIDFFAASSMFLIGMRKLGKRMQRLYRDEI